MGILDALDQSFGSDGAGFGPGGTQMTGVVQGSTKQNTIREQLLAAHARQQSQKQAIGRKPYAMLQFTTDFESRPQKTATTTTIWVVQLNSPWPMVASQLKDLL